MSCVDKAILKPQNIVFYQFHPIMFHCCTNLDSCKNHIQCSKFVIYLNIIIYQYQRLGTAYAKDFIFSSLQFSWKILL